jgi:Tfp pilus assembly protein PilW
MNLPRPNLHTESGQTLIALLIFMMLIILVTTAAATITIINVRTNTAYAAGDQALQNAESGAENALQRLLRDPGYTGETIVFTNGTATINVSGTTMKTITSQGANGNYRRTITATADYTNNVLVLNSWSEAL